MRPNSTVDELGMENLKDEQLNNYLKTTDQLF